MPCGGGERAHGGILERLDAGEIVIGDGGFVIALEKRGYVKAGPWTPEAAVEHPEAGASIVGVNCHFDPETCLRTVKLMKEGLEAAQLKAHLMSQPLAFHTPDCGKQGFIDLPEFPFALEPRIVTRWDVQKYAREAYNLGIRYIGGCCGFEPYHIRAIAEELAPERGFLARKEYWENLMPASGRPYCPSMSKPDNWGVTKGAADLMQQKEATTEQQLKELFKKQKFKSNIVA
uniref:Hcy-binding domain-containing protein n=1 Tax=Chelonoidis abingdonii TaxID=106734 RepID=A0A8C0IRS3_CHEAB